LLHAKAKRLSKLLNKNVASSSLKIKKKERI